MGPRFAALVVVAACGASLGDSNDHPDGAVDGKLIDAGPDARPCTGGDAHTSDGTSCFVFVRSPVIHDDAKAACAAMNGHLARVENATQNAMIATMITGVDSFIGATDLANEGTFVWDDGSPLTYTNWRAGEPSSGGGMYEEDCAIIEGAKTPDDTWDDRPCAPVVNVGGGLYGYVCQY
jgi:hypothetical protein